MAHFANTLSHIGSFDNIPKPVMQTNHVAGTLYHYFSVSGTLRVFLVADPDGRYRGVVTDGGSMIACDATDAVDQLNARTFLDNWNKYQNALREEEAKPLPELLVVVVQPWQERDRDSGPRSDGVTLHLTRADRDKYVKEYHAKYNNKDQVPDYYVTTEGEPTIAEISPELYRKVRRGRPGVMLSESDRRRLKLLVGDVVASQPGPEEA